MADSASSGGGTPPSKPPTMYITVDLGPLASSAGRDAGSPQSSKPPVPTSKRPVVWEPPDAADLAKVLPGYDVLALVGSGGMGAVYRARQKSLERLVAVKVLSPELAERAPEFTERFNNEASALAKLSHPSIVHLFDCGHTKDGQLYIAMELVEGRDVAERLGGKQPLPAQEALSIAIDVCEALAHAHQRGVVHRDIKPANVMLDKGGRVKITDFGLARIIQKAVPKERMTTSLLGTPRFTAPEALTPGAEVDARADIFSTGVMLYQMLTGEVPRGAAPPPSSLVPGLDTRFDDIVSRAMAEDPGARHQSAGDLRDALEAIRKIPDPVDLPAATLLDLKGKSARPKAPVGQGTAPAPIGPHHGEESFSTYEPPQSAARGSMTPWLFTAAVLSVGGYWAWQNLKNPHQGMLVDATSVNSIRTTDDAGSGQPLTPPLPISGTDSSPPLPPLTPAPSVTATPPPSPSMVPEQVPDSPPPVVAPVSTPEDLTDAQRRVSQIQGDFDAAVKEWQAGQDTKLAQLSVQYLRAVRNGVTSMRNARRLDDLAGLEEEERLISSKAILPSVDAQKQPERARLRKIYDAQVQEIARAGAETKLEIYNRLLGSLFAYQSILKQTNKPAASEMVSGVLDRTVKERDALRSSLGSTSAP